MLLKNKVALITGASRGIGAATARLFGENGAAVAVNYVANEKAAQEVVKEIESRGGKGAAFRADVTDRAQVQRMVDEIHFKLGPIDILVINAGLRFKVAPFVQQSWEEFEAKYVGEMKAAFFCCEAVVPEMLHRKSGCIVAVSSGLSWHPGDGFVAHSTAKSALNAFVRSLAHELGPHGIRVNTISPGLTLTDATAWLPEEHKKAAAGMTPLRRVALPEDLASAVLFMASDYARFVTGAYLPVDGGITMP